MDEAVETTTPGEEARRAGTTRSLARAGIIVTLAFGISRMQLYCRLRKYGFQGA